MTWYAISVYHRAYELLFRMLHRDDMLGTMLDIHDSTKEIMDWIAENGGWEKNAMYVTAGTYHVCDSILCILCALLTLLTTMMPPIET